jgi:hypothetical protein
MNGLDGPVGPDRAVGKFIRYRMKFTFGGERRQRARRLNFHHHLLIESAFRT